MIAVARAMMAKPKMLLLDEPTMGLAPQLVAEIFNIVKELNTKEGVSILLAEQNTNVALKNSDYGYIIETGRVMLDGTAQSLLNDDKAVSYTHLRAHPFAKEFVYLLSFHHIQLNHL